MSTNSCEARLIINVFLCETNTVRSITIFSALFILFKVRFEVFIAAAKLRIDDSALICAHK